MRVHGHGSVYNFTGLERSLPLQAGDFLVGDDEIAPALCGDRLRRLALEHLGGRADVHDVAVFNRLTAATVATHLTRVGPGDVVVGVSPSYSHPTVGRAAASAGAEFVETHGVREFESAIRAEEPVTLVALTRLALTYDVLGTEESGMS